MRALASRLRTGLIVLTGTGAGASIVLALLVLASVFVAMATPRASLGFRTSALRHAIAETPATGRVVTGSLDMPTLGGALGPPNQPAYAGMDATQFGPIGAEIGRHLRTDQIPLVPGASWWGVTTNSLAGTGAAKSAYFGQAPPLVELVDRSSLSKYVRVVAGRLPSADSLGRTSARFDIAVTPATARRFSVRPGSVITLADSDFGAVSTLRLRVTGIVRPLHSETAYWTADPIVAAPSLTKTRTGAYWSAGMIISDAELNDLEVAISDQNITVTWAYPLRLGQLNADQAVGLNSRLSELAADGVLTRSVVTSTNVPLLAPVSGTLSQFVQTEAELGTLLSLLYVSLTVVGLVVLLLGARLLAERRAGEFGLIRARGADRAQLTMVAARAGAVVVVPAALAGAALAVLLTPGQDEPLAWWLAGITCLVALASVPWLALRHARLITERADTPPPRRVRARRIVIDAAAVLAAAAGLVVLRLQGQPSGSGTDWFTSAAPVLVAIPMAIVVVRAYPVVLRWLVALAGRRQGVTTFIGLARATRASASAVLPAFALVLALGVIAFGAMLRAAVADGDVAQSWRAVGADVVIDTSKSNNPLTPEAARAIAAVPGVQEAVTGALTAGTTSDGTVIAVIAVNPARYAALVARTPAARIQVAPLAHAPPATGLPALASPGAATALAHGSRLLIGVRTVPVHVAGGITSGPGFQVDGPFILVASQVADRVLRSGRPVPNTVLIVGNPDHARLAAVVRKELPGAIAITYRSSVLTALTGADLQRGAYVTFAQAAVAAAGFGAMIMLIMLALGARARELTLARLFTMGLSRGQARLLVSAEALPAILAAAAGGAVCAWALVPLLAPSIDLSVFTGGTAGVPVHANFVVIGYLAIALIVLAVATMSAQSLATRLRGVSRALRVGE